MSGKRVLVVLALVALVAFAVVTPVAAGAGNPYPRDDELTLSDVQMLGTHNSYHKRPARDLIANEPADYEHPPLDVQLDDDGMRSLELDVFNGPTLPVLHSLLLDEGSTCPDLEDCLRTISTWSKANPGHVPLILFIEPKALPINTNPDLQAAIDTEVAERGLANWDAVGFERLDALVRDVFGGTLITPDEVRGKRPTLRDAILRDGWPTLAETRGGVLVVLGASGLERDTYLAGTPSLEGRPMFVPSDVAEPSAAIIKRDVPLPNAFPRIVSRNFLVKTRADADAVEARAGDLSRANSALASGATVVATDYPVADPRIGPYVVDLPGTAVARCNPVTAPTWCRDRDIENARGLRHP
jgi:hypothetical protein